MRKQTKLLVGIACGFALTGLFVAFHHQPEPTYGGYTLSCWTQRYSRAYSRRQMAYLPGSNLSYVGVDAAAEEAIRAIGTNAFPVLLRWLHFEQDHSAVRLYYSLRLNRLPSFLRDRIRHLAFGEAGANHAQEALYVVHILGPQATGVATDLFRLCGNPAEPDTAYRCFYALGTLGTNALPQLMQVLRDARHPYRGVAVRQVEDVLRRTPGPSLADSVLLQCLQDRDTSLVILASQRLSETMRNRELALPALQANLSSADPVARTAASNALFTIAFSALTNSPLPIGASR